MAKRKKVFKISSKKVVRKVRFLLLVVEDVLKVNKKQRKRKMAEVMEQEYASKAKANAALTTGRLS